MEKYSAHDVMEINSREIVNAPVKDNHTKRCWWIYVKNKRLMGANWCPRYAVLESVKTENVQEGLPLYKTVIKIYKEPGKKVLVKIPVDEVLEFHSADDIDLEKLDKSNGGSWGKIMVFIRDKEKVSPTVSAP